jgi:Beta-lactamase enzyme family
MLVAIALTLLGMTGSPPGALAAGTSSGSNAVSRALKLVAAQRRHMTAAVLSFDGRTRLGRNASRLEPLGSTTNILILDEAAHEIAAGRLHAQTAIPLVAIDDTYLPGTDGGAHAAALTAERNRGWIHGNALSLRHVLDAMIEFSDNAATDTVMRLIDDRALARRAARLGQDAPLSPGGLFLSWGAGIPAAARAVRSPAYNATVEQLARRLESDGTFRLQVFAGLATGRYPSTAQQAKRVAALAPRGSAMGYARLLRRILTGRDSANRLAASVLGWPLRASRKLQPLFTTLAQKGGELPGVLTAVDGIAPRGFPGYITVLFFHGISESTRATLKKTDAFDVVPVGIAVSSAFRGRARAALGLR